MEYTIDQRPSYSILKIKLEPGESVISEAGAMVLFKGDIEIGTHTGGGLLKGLMRGILGTEAVFMNTYRARSKAEIWFAPTLPGDIRYIPLHGDSWIVQDMSYLAHHGDVDVSIAWRGLRGVLAEGELFWLRLSGHGGVWVNAYGGLEELKVPAGEVVTIDNFHFVAMPETVDYRIRKFGGWKSFLLGGEGLVFDVRGPAVVYLQTRILLPFARLMKKFIGD